MYQMAGGDLGGFYSESTLAWHYFHSDFAVWIDDPRPAVAGTSEWRWLVTTAMFYQAAQVHPTERSNRDKTFKIETFPKLLPLQGHFCQQTKL